MTPRSSGRSSLDTVLWSGRKLFNGLFPGTVWSGDTSSLGTLRTRGRVVRGEEPGECKRAPEIFQGFGASPEKRQVVFLQVLKKNSQSQMSRHQFKAGPGQAWSQALAQKASAGSLSYLIKMTQDSEQIQETHTQGESCTSKGILSIFSWLNLFHHKIMHITIKILMRYMKKKYLKVSSSFLSEVTDSNSSLYVFSYNFCVYISM